MGNISSGNAGAHEAVSPPSSHHERRKRLAEEMIGEQEVEDVSPRRKRIQSTSDYIYETLFNRGADSDITICALGKEWKLHRLYLRQSGYFSSMFSGSWKESNETQVTLDIPDLNITREALNIAFSSLYRDEFPLDEVQMCSIVAASSMLQLDGLLEHCKIYMRENIKPDNVVGFLTASSMYGLTDVEDECRKWLLLHLLKRYTTALLKDMSCQLLSELLLSPNLYVMQIEMDVYTLAKKWLFLAQNPDWSGDSEKLLGDAEEFFRTRGPPDSSFLSEEDSEEYFKVFKAVRLQHILNDKPSLTTIEADKIFPKSWLLDFYRKQWLKMLSVEQRLDAGPCNQTEEQFNGVSVRCGRVIYEPGDYCWRWTGYSFGFDTLVTYCSNTGIVAIKRNTKMQPCANAVSMQPKRPIAVRLRAVSFEEGEAVFSCLNSGIMHLSLSPDEEYPLLKNVPNSHFPIYISVNFSLTSADTIMS